MNNLPKLARVVTYLRPSVGQLANHVSTWKMAVKSGVLFIIVPLLHVLCVCVAVNECSSCNWTSVPARYQRRSRFSLHLSSLLQAVQLHRC